jgi:hypothetical protein
MQLSKTEFTLRARKRARHSRLNHIICERIRFQKQNYHQRNHSFVYTLSELSLQSIHKKIRFLYIIKKHHLQL